MHNSLVQRGGAILLMMLTSALSPHSVFAQNVADNIRPIGSICLVGQACVGTVARAMVEGSPEAIVADSANTAQVAEDSEVAEEPTADAAPMEVAAAASDFDEAAASFGDNTEGLQLGQVSDGFNAEQKYMASCFACHSTGAAGAPKVGAGMIREWAPRLEKGLDAVVANAVNGVNAMPAKGLCFDCNEDDIRALVDYMLETSQ